MPKKINVSILGAAGYTGIELLRYLVNHPFIELKHLISHTHSGQKISDVWPHLKGVCDMPLTNIDLQKVAVQSDLVFLALPHHETQKIVPEIIGKTKIIDLSGDFRVRDKNLYAKYYGHEHEFASGISQFIYGMPELYKREIGRAKNIANPGCFAIACQLALLPLRGTMNHTSIVAITGSSGSGKNPREETHHPVRNHNLSSYKIGTHQHIPEIIQTLGIAESQMSFVPVSGPFTRGIHLTAFVEPADQKKSFEQGQLTALYEKMYADAPFVRLKKNVQLAEIVGSNFCDITAHAVNGKIIIQAVIDNLGKGAAGNAVQNMNLMCGFDETAGLITLSPLFP